MERGGPGSLSRTIMELLELGEQSQKPARVNKNSFWPAHDPGSDPGGQVWSVPSRSTVRNYQGADSFLDVTCLNCARC